MLYSVESKWFWHFSCKKLGMANIDCQLHRLYCHHGNKPLAMPVMEFLDWVRWSRKNHPACRWHSFLLRGLTGLSKRRIWDECYHPFLLSFLTVVHSSGLCVHGPDTLPACVCWWLSCLCPSPTVVHLQVRWITHFSCEHGHTREDLLTFIFW